MIIRTPKIGLVYDNTGFRSPMCLLNKLSFYKKIGQSPDTTIMLKELFFEQLKLYK